LDAFDFFSIVFVLKDVAKQFGTSVEAVSVAIVVTLAARPVGALLFGLASEKFGRRSVLMVDILCFSVLELISGFSTDLTMFIILRALFGVAMGGEWGVGASLVMETIPPKSRGIVSGILQAGYPSGYLIASLVFFLLYPVIGWRGMFIVGALPALLVYFLRRSIPESPAFTEGAPAERQPIWPAIQRNIGSILWVVLMMAAFNFFSHGSQDLYPTFLEVQRGFGTHATGAIAIFYNIGAIIGGIIFGALSQHIGRRRAIVIAAILMLPSGWLWVYAPGTLTLAIGAFLVQFFVQGAWGVVPVHLNELSPPGLRGTFPGTAYQLGNLIASGNATLLTALAGSWQVAGHPDYGRAMLVEMVVVAIAVAVFAGFGREARNKSFAPGAGDPA
ncbi:MFS transporter, partial [Thioclava sp. BHET1]